MIEPEIDRILSELIKQIQSQEETGTHVTIPLEDANRLAFWAGMMRDAEIIRTSRGTW